MRKDWLWAGWFLSVWWFSPGSPGGSVVKNLPAVQKTQEMWVQSQDREDPLEEGMANPLQYSCLENPMDRGARWAVGLGATKSETRPKQISTAHTQWFSSSAVIWALRCKNCPHHLSHGNSHGNAICLSDAHLPASPQIPYCCSHREFSICCSGILALERSRRHWANYWGIKKLTTGTPPTRMHQVTEDYELLSWV